MTVGEFFLGLLIIVIGVFVVARSKYLDREVGDLSLLIGYGWAQWSVLGVALLFLGAFVMLGLWKSIILAILGPLFTGF